MYINIIKMIAKSKNSTRLSSTNTKSSANFVSAICPKQSQKLKNGKLTVQYSKIFKPSVNLYAEYLNKSAIIPKKPSISQNSDSDDQVNPRRSESSETLKRVQEFYERHKQRPFMQVLNQYKKRKSEIQLEKSLKFSEFSSSIKTLEEENAALEAELELISQQKEKKITQEEIQAILSKFSGIGNKSELTTAICAEFCNFRISKSWPALQKLNLQIAEFFNMAGLEESYNDIISTFCTQILVEMRRSQEAKNKVSKVSSQKGNVTKVFETLKAFETEVSMSAVNN